MICQVRDKVRRNDHVHSFLFGQSAQSMRRSDMTWLVQTAVSSDPSSLCQRAGWIREMRAHSSPRDWSTASDVWHACMYDILCMCVCILYVMAWLTFKDVLALAGWRTGEACIQQRRGPCGGRGKMTHLRQEKASMFGADRARARVDDTQPRGRQCPHSPCLQSPFPEHREARGAPLGCSTVFNLAGARCRGAGGSQGGATGQERCMQI